MVFMLWFAYGIAYFYILFCWCMLLLLIIILKIYTTHEFLKFRQTSKGMKWSHETVQKALQLKFSCGKSGYETLLGQGQPLPSIRTLQRRMQDIRFESGMLHEVFKLLTLKVCIKLEQMISNKCHTAYFCFDVPFYAALNLIIKTLRQS